MPEKAIISHRGEKYEIGRGKRFYGIWVVGAPYEAPVDRWPETREGWEQAWSRFATVEVPGTIAPVPSQRFGLGTSARLVPRDGRVGPQPLPWANHNGMDGGGASGMVRPSRHGSSGSAR